MVPTETKGEKKKGKRGRAEYENQDAKTHEMGLALRPNYSLGWFRKVSFEQ